MAAPYRAAPQTTPNPMPTADGRTGEDELASFGAPAVFSLDVLEELGELGEAPSLPAGNEPARTGMALLIMSVRALIEAF